MAEYVIVGGVLLLAPHHSRGVPNQRIAPEQGTRELGNQQCPTIVTIQVPALVHQHNAAALVIPFSGRIGQQH